MERKKEFADCLNAGKQFFLVFLGSLFVQVFCWAMYSYLEMSVWMFAASAVVTALLYHFVQLEQQIGLERISVFFAAILTPFLLGLTVTVIQLVQHPNLNLLSAELDGVSPMTELVSLYSARLVVNGVLLLLFAAAEAAYLKSHPPKERVSDDSD